MSTLSRKEILEMLSQGEINAAEAARLLNQPDGEPAGKAEPAAKAEAEPAVKAPPEPAPPLPPPPDGSLSWLKVQINHLDTGENKVSVNVPLPVFKFGFKVAQRFVPELEDLDVQELTRAVHESKQGLLADIKDKDDNTHIVVSIV